MDKKLIFVSGTDTGVGKTVVSALIVAILKKRKINAGYFKPISCGTSLIEGKMLPADSYFVKQVARLEDNLEDLGSYVFQNPVSPHLASRLEGVQIDPLKITRDIEKQLKKVEILIIEGCGGLAVPINDKGYLVSHLIKDLNAETLLVSRAGLGTINHTLLSLEHAKLNKIKVLGLIFNYYTGSMLEKENLRYISNECGEKIIGQLPGLTGLNVDLFQMGDLLEVLNSPSMDQLANNLLAEVRLL
jgi:dethiobiotin synthetase